MITRFMVSVDTEFSIGGYFGDPRNLPVDADRHIFCRINGRDHGIGMIMDIMEESGIRGVFFLETEARHYFGEDIYRRIVAAIVDRGHEIQMHAHPVFRHFKDLSKPRRTADNFGDLGLDEQIDIIAEGRRFLESCGSGTITAFRAGNFEAGPLTVRACADAGIRFLSNQNLAMPGCKYLDSRLPWNRPYEIEPGIFEVPITVFRESGGRKDWNGFQVCAASSSELRLASTDYAERGYGLIQFLTHSFELVKNGDDQFRLLSPNKLHADRFRKTCRFLASNPRRFRNAVFKDLAAEGGFDRAADDGFYVSPFPEVVRRYAENISGWGLSFNPGKRGEPAHNAGSGSMAVAGLLTDMARSLL